MRTGVLLVAVTLLPLTGCVMTPRFEVAETIEFNAPMPDQAVMSLDDMLCCYECNA